jgi:hypothetical protein
LITFQVTRIIRQVFVGSELDGVYVNADDHSPFCSDRSARAFHKTSMARVQKTHRGHEGDFPVSGFPAFGQLLHPQSCCDKLHIDNSA